MEEEYDNLESDNKQIIEEIAVMKKQIIKAKEKLSKIKDKKLD